MMPIKTTFFGHSASIYRSVGIGRLYIPIVMAIISLSVILGPVSAADDITAMIGPKDALLVTAPDGSDIFAINESALGVPASTLKLFTSLVALHYLGSHYRFPTDIFMDENRNLIIKGFGDPLLISEVVGQIVDILASDLIEVNDIVLDDTYFSQPINIPGRSASSQPYDAPNGALCANFNTIEFKKNSAGQFISTESQTPLVPFVIPKLRASGLQFGRIVLSHRQDENVLYVGHLFMEFLKRSGIQCYGVVRTGTVNPMTDRRILHHLSPFTLEDVIQKLLKHSNNFIANQLIIAVGAQVQGLPGNLEKGMAAARSFSKKILGMQNFQLVEGSGISRKNRLSARELMRVVEAFSSYRHLMTQKGRINYKTGSLSGISTLAGFIRPKMNQNDNKELYRFVVFLNSPGKPAEHVIQRVLKHLP